MSSIEAVIQGPGRLWRRSPGAAKGEITALRAAVPFNLPEQYVQLLEFSNGGEGELALPALWFQLFDTQFAVQLWRDSHYRREFPSLFFFGSNGGLESIAFDMTNRPPWPVVMVDCIAGLESATRIAANVDEFIQAIGLAAHDDGA